MNRTIALAVLVACVSLPAFAASWSPDGHRIAYSFIGGPESLHVMDADGSRAHAILAREQRDFQPEWAPDGSYLVFTSVVDGVHVMMRIQPDGTGLTALSEPEEAAGDPDVSPDGRSILYFTDEPLPRDLYVRDIESGATRALTETADFQEMSPRWSPDGRQVVFVGRPDEEGAEGDIWTLDLAGGGRHNLTSTPDVGEFHPDWSHDGRHVVYIRVEDGNFAVAVRDVASGEERIVADGNGYAVLSPHFSPDDRYLTFTRTDFAEQGPGMPAIVQVSIEDGSEITLVQGIYLTQM